MQVTPLSSGYALGSSNWIIQSHYEKVSYVSGSSLLTTHPQVQPLLIDFYKGKCPCQKKKQTKEKATEGQKGSPSWDQE